MNRRTHKQKVLDLLRDGRWHGHMEGYRLGVMLHSRVADLRKDGYEIVCKRGAEGYLYRLVGSLDETDVGVRRDAFSLASVSSSEPVPSIPSASLDDGARAPGRGGGQLALSFPVRGQLDIEAVA